MAILCLLKKFSKFLLFAAAIAALMPNVAFSAVSNQEYLAALYDARGIELKIGAVAANGGDESDDESEKRPSAPAQGGRIPATPEEKAEAALKMGFAGKPLTGIAKVRALPLGGPGVPITRMEAVRFAIQSLGLSFEAIALGGVRPTFTDTDALNAFDKGCLTVAQRMVPQLWGGSGGGAFTPNKPLEQGEMAAMVQAVVAASQALLLELDVSPAKGISIRFHREGAFSGAPKWRVVVHGFKSETEAKTGAAQLANLKLTTRTLNYDWKVQSELIEDWREVENVYNIVQNFGRPVSIVPAVANINKDNLPRFWVAATVAKDAFDVNMLLPPAGITTLATMTQMRRGKDEPLLAINGGYFTWTGRDLGLSIGTLVAGGEIANSPYLERTTIGWSQNAAPVFASVKWEQEVEIPFAPTEKFSIINNFSIKNNTFLMAYTPIYSRNGKKTPKPEFAATELVLNNDGIIIEKSAGGSTVKEGTIILASYGVKAVLLDNRRVGDRIDIDFGLMPFNGDKDAWSKVTEAVQAGPMILMNGIVNILSEGFDGNFVNSRHPRTAVGTNTNGDWIFFVGDGRNGSHSIGFSLAETASIMQAYGARDILNLDGGGSTEMLLRGSFFNWPSEGRERPVSNAIGVFARRIAK